MKDAFVPIARLPDKNPSKPLSIAFRPFDLHSYLYIDTGNLSAITSKTPSSDERVRDERVRSSGFFFS